MDYYKPTFFTLEELLPEEFYHENKYREEYLWTICFDPRTLWTADRLRKRFGSMTVNTWKWPNIKKHQFRGYRPPNCTIGSKLSQHRYGRALDLIPRDIGAEKIREQILANPFSEDFQFITCLEINISWLHFDTRNWNKTKNGILTVKG
jgi:hypothetical protein